MAWNYSAAKAFEKIPVEDRLKRIVIVFTENSLSVDDVLSKSSGDIYVPFINEFGLLNSIRYQKLFAQFISRNKKKIKDEVFKLFMAASNITSTNSGNEQAIDHDDFTSNELKGNSAHNPVIEDIKDDNHVTLEEHPIHYDDCLTSIDLKTNSSELDFKATSDEVIYHNSIVEDINVINAHHIQEEETSHSMDEITSVTSDLLQSDVSNAIEDYPKHEESVTVAFNITTESLAVSKPRNQLRTDLIGSFKISSVDWNSMVDACDGKLKTTVYPHLLSKYFFEVNKGCVVQMKNVNYHKPSSGNLCTVYAYCSHSRETKFHFKCKRIANNDVYVQVYSNQISCNHETKKTRQLSGVKRTKMMQRLTTHASTKLIRLDTVKHADTEGLQQNNLQDITSYNVLRQAKSEYSARYDLHKDPLMDLFLMRSFEQDVKKNRYLQLVSHPLLVVIFSDMTMRLAKMWKAESMKNKSELVMHIDATGSVVRKTKECEDKTVLYYAVVFRMSNKYILPLTEFISCNHNASAIGMWLLKFREFAIKEKIWPVCKRIVSDFSWAIINAIMTTWNQMDVVTYINSCHRKVQGQEVDVSPTVTVHICVCHFVKMVVSDVKVSSKIDGISDPKDQKAFKLFVMQVVCTLVTCCDYNKIKTIIRHTLIVLLSENESRTVQKSLGELSTFCQPMDENAIEDDVKDDVEVEQSKKKGHEAMYEKSKFYKDTLAIMKHVNEILSKSEIKKDKDADSDSDTYEHVQSDNETHENVRNVYKNKHMADILTKKYVPYLPLWSGIMLEPAKGKDTTDKRLSNAPIENHFGQIKNVVLEKQRNLRVNRFVRKVHDYVDNTAREIIHKIPKEGCANRKRKMTMNSQSEPSAKTMKISTSQSCNLVHSVAVPSIQAKTSNADLPLVESQRKRCIGEMQAKRNALAKNHEPVETINLDDCEETWGKTDTRSATYFSSRYLQFLCNEMPQNAVNAIKSKIIPNSKLINDPSYYSEQLIYDEGKGQRVPINYLVCSIETPSHEPFLLYRNEISTLSDKGTFSDKEWTQWLCTDIVSACGFMFIKDKPTGSSVIFHSQVGLDSIKLRKSLDKDHPILWNSIVSKNTKNLFFPICYNSHWILLYVNMERNEFSYLNPYTHDETDEEVNKYFEGFMKFFKNHISTYLGTIGRVWMIKSYKHPHQTDMFNCGVFVLHFIEQLINNDSIDLRFDPTEYRVDLFHRLLANSLRMTNYCLTCSRPLPPGCPTRQEDQSVECNACGRWYHVSRERCNPPITNKTMQELCKEHIKVYCFVCKAYSLKLLKR